MRLEHGQRHTYPAGALPAMHCRHTLPLPFPPYPSASVPPCRALLLAKNLVHTRPGPANAADNNDRHAPLAGQTDPSRPLPAAATAHTRAMLQDPEPPSGAAGDANAPSPTSATDNATAAASGNAPSSSPSPAAINAPAGGSGGGGDSAGANAPPPAAGTFPGYPRSGGLLSPQLAPLLVAIQEAHLYNDSKTAV